MTTRIPTPPTFYSDTTAVEGGGALDREEAFCSACGQSFAHGTELCPNDGAKLIQLGGGHDALIGRVFENRYEVRSRLGAGGMGTVYRGWQMSVDREVAIKVIDPRLSSDRVTVKRFLREARLSSRLSQPNIVNVYDFGQSDDGILYLVMELLRGHTLASVLQARPIGVRRASTIAQQLCDALESAHAQGIIHRDLKPGNIIVLDDPPGRDLIKVLDFGLSKSLTGDALSRVTKTDTVLGTPLYMSPEQIDGKPSDPRADLYAFGCIYYEMLAGRPPFVDSNMHTILARHMSEPAPRLPPGIPAALADLVDKMLAKRVEDRVQSAAEVRRVIQRVLEGGVPDVIAMTLPPARSHAEVAVAVTAASTGASHLPYRARTRSPVRRAAIVIAAGLSLGVAAAGVAVVVKSRPGSADSSVSDAAIAGSGSGRAVPAGGTVAIDAAVAVEVDAAATPIDADVPVILDAALAAHPPAHPTAHPPPHPPAHPPTRPPDPPAHTVAVDAGVPAGPVDAPPLDFVPHHH